MTDDDMAKRRHGYTREARVLLSRATLLLGEVRALHRDLMALERTVAAGTDTEAKVAIETMYLRWRDYDDATTPCT